MEVDVAAALGRLDRCAARRADPLQKAGGDGRLAGALPRPAEDRLARAERGDKVVRRLADTPLRGRKSELGPHRAVEKGVGLDRRRPDFFVESCDERAVEGEEARFEQTQDLEPRMAALRVRGSNAGERFVEQRRIFGERAGKAFAGRLAPLVHHFFECIEPMVRSLLASRRGHERGERRPMRLKALAQRATRGLQGLEDRREIARELFCRAARLLADRAHGRMRVAVRRRRPRVREGLVEIVERGDGRSTEDCELERAGGVVALLQRAAEPRRRMGEKRLGVERRRLDRRLEDEPRERARFALAERAPSRILDLHAPSRQLLRHAPGDRWIGRNERRRLARRLQDFAHGDGERERLLSIGVRDDDRDPVEGGGDG